MHASMNMHVHLFIRVCKILTILMWCVRFWIQNVALFSEMKVSGAVLSFQKNNYVCICIRYWIWYMYCVMELVWTRILFYFWLHVSWALHNKMLTIDSFIDCYCSLGTECIATDPQNLNAEYKELRKHMRSAVYDTTLIYNSTSMVLFLIERWNFGKYEIWAVKRTRRVWHMLVYLRVRVIMEAWKGVFVYIFVWEIYLVRRQWLEHVIPRSRLLACLFGNICQTRYICISEYFVFCTGSPNICNSNGFIDIQKTIYAIYI